MVVAVAVTAACGQGASVADWRVTSPDGSIAMTVRLVDGELRYAATVDDVLVIEESSLGLVRDDADLSTGLELKEASQLHQVHESYSLVHGKRSEGLLHGNQQTLSFVNADGHVLELVLFTADDGVAFRYRVPGSGTASVVDELTSFTVPPGRAWIQPTQMSDYYAPAYENLYSNGVPTGLGAPVPSWNLPALFEADGYWSLISESDLTGSYVGGHIDNRGSGRTYRFAMPQVSEGLGVGDRNPKGQLPMELPWRVIMLGRTAAAVATSDLVNALAPSPTGGFEWVKPGRVSWSWWSDHNSPRDLDSLRDHIDLSVEMGWEYTLIDANWTVHDEADVRSVIDYATSQGVGVFLWYNSGGPNNSVTEQPRDRMYDRAVRQAEMDRLVEWDVVGVKVDFFHSDKQESIARYLAITADAAERGLMVNFHGSTIPRGWSRTWPNMMTMEGVRGAEQYGIDAEYPADAAWHNVVLAFTRNVVGPMDYTPVTFSDQRFPHQTTNAHELALSVVFESGLLHLADAAESYRSQSDATRAFLRNVRAHWDETTVLDGAPGEYIVVARRSGDMWCLGGISGMDSAITVTVDTSFLSGSSALLLTDGHDTRSIADSQIELSDGLRIDMAARGGFSLMTESRA